MLICCIVKRADLLNIKSLTREALQQKLTSIGMKSYRADQILSWIFQRHARSFEEMTNIAKTEREVLDSTFSIPAIQVLQVECSTDGTRKVLFGLEDGHTIESVLIPDEDRLTLCISSQVGCAQGCRFCLTGSHGFIRDLRSWEITDQVLQVARMLLEENGRPVTNIVLMGMGEPLANFDEVVAALRVMTAEKGLGISTRRITLSTAGLAPKIKDLASAGTRVNLAVSLNAPTDEVRDRIMPVNKRWPLKELLAACRQFPLEPRRRITFEYVLLGGVNDSEQDALAVVRLLRGIKCKINLIPFNPFPGSAFRRPGERNIRVFQQILLSHQYTAPVRESRGSDISAACGQLREKASSTREP